MNRRLLGTEAGRTDRVTAVIIPMDGATRIPIRQGIDVEWWDVSRGEARPVRLVRNLQGHSALLNQDPDQDLTFRILTERSDYRGPVLESFNPLNDGTARVVALERRTDAAFDDIATLIRGVVVRPDPQHPWETLPATGVTVSVLDVEASRHQFPVSTDERGSFALIVDIRRPQPDEAPTIGARIRFDPGGLPPRILDVALTHGLAHVFSAPVDLEQNGPIPFSHR